jgi:hypothetical protein
MPDEKHQRDFTPPPSSGTPPAQQDPQGVNQDQALPPDQLPLVDELGIIDVDDPLAGGRGRLFSAAGRFSPLIEFTDKHVIMHPPQLPFSEDGPAEEIVTRVDERGVLLDELGAAKHVAGARFKGEVLWYLGEQLPGTTKYLVCWFDKQGHAHKLYVNEEPLTVDVVFRLRNKTHDGELSFFADVTTD